RKIVQPLEGDHMERADHVGTVVHRDLRLVGERRLDVAVVGLIVLALDGEYAGPVIPREVSRDVILCREWIGGAQGHVRPPGLERYGEVRRLGGDMQAGRDLLPLER